MSRSEPFKPWDLVSRVINRVTIVIVIITYNLN